MYGKKETLSQDETFSILKPRISPKFHNFVFHESVVYDCGTQMEKIL